MMRKIFSFMFASLDGYHESLDGDIDWQDVDDEFDAYDLAQLDEADTILLGRRTYDGFADFWPTPAGQDADPVRAELFGKIDKVVVSRTLTDPPWANTVVISTDVEAALRALKSRPGKDIEIIGSAILTAHLIPVGLVDKIRIMVSPVILGSGHPAFPVTGPIGLTLLWTQSFGNGNTLLAYRPEVAEAAS